MNSIKVQNARKYFLKNVCVDLPKNNYIAITGVSGSGKSTFAFDIIYEEGSARYLKALSNDSSSDYNQGRDYDFIKGLAPAVALKQNVTNNTNPRSTIATLTEIGNYFRLLFWETSQKKCKKCFSINHIQSNKCCSCGELFQPISDKYFSFNTDEGMCKTCHGLGHTMDFDIDLIIPEPWKTLQEQPWGKDYGTIFSNIKYYYTSVAREYGFDPNLPYEQLPEFAQRVILYGSVGRAITVQLDEKGYSLDIKFEGIIHYLRRAYQTNKSESRLKSIEKYMRKVVCPDCEGTRFNIESRKYYLGKHNIVELYDMEFVELKDYVEVYNNTIKNIGNEAASFACKQIYDRLAFLCELGLSYLKLNRQTSTLSKGELQNIRLSDHLGSDISGVIYVLDEPTSGLHIKNAGAITKAIKRIRNNGNTVLVIEHNRDVIKEADYILDFGPGGGKAGGEICYFGNFEGLKKAESSLTAQYYFGEKRISIPTKRRKVNKFLQLEKVYKNNINDLYVKIPLNSLVVVTGASGSGKSTLIMEVLYNELQKKINNIIPEDKYKASISNYEGLCDVIAIDASPIGRMVRSNVATYTGVFDRIRKIYSNLKEAKDEGITSSMFSFNVKGGRCERCEGLGKVLKHVFFADEVYVQCPKCNGKRYMQDVLKIKYRGKSISDVLDMTVEEAYEHFKDFKSVQSNLEMLITVGVGYITMGQLTTTLSGGEAQRIKLATHLSKKNTSNTMYMLDEPTSGLHFYDIEKLLSMLNYIVDKGNSVIIIEHNMEAIKVADYVIDMGPDGGKNGGQVTGIGTPEEIANGNSCTAEFLKEYL